MSSLILALLPIIGASGHHLGWRDLGCPSPLYCEAFTGLPAYADAAETFSDNAWTGPDEPGNYRRERPALLIYALD